MPNSTVSTVENAQPRRARRPVSLLAFHHAGGSTTAFAGWQGRLRPQVEVVPVRLPGRGPDGRSPRYDGMESLTEALAHDLAPLLDRPHLMYGHSMGALIAYRLARLRAERGQRAPDRLMVGAFAAPHHAARRRRLDDPELARQLMRGTAASLPRLDHGGQLTAMSTRLREDLRLCGTDPLDWTAAPVLDCPIEVFMGTDDPLVPVADARDWTRHSTAGATLHMIPGGHFFPRESKGHFFRKLHTVTAHPLGSVDDHSSAAAQPMTATGPFQASRSTVRAAPR
ncbi:surfactin synthase thioesterase subunit [Streptomyces sp. 846.5]|nr:alpha/beta fold hydrolase [Streptomyces sp. 846.5]TDU04076.1 surfactin synthase thioesterase subunit [Streptomyces sp. 846.5]